MKILVADNDLTSRAVLTAVLSKWGFDVRTVADGPAALEEVSEPDSPKLVVLDRMMPGLDGLEVCRRLREGETSMPRYIIMVTTLGSSGDVVDGLTAGADDYPFNNDELAARIRVGRRVIGLQDNAVEREGLNGVVEMAGALCHELNQPLQVISSTAELLLMDLEQDAPCFQEVQTIERHAARLGDITQKIMAITDYKTRDYLTGTIVDIHGLNEEGTPDLSHGQDGRPRERRRS